VELKAPLYGIHVSLLGPGLLIKTAGVAVKASALPFKMQ
jgi:hypothetical protein